jgi:hypothetical protein
MLRYSILMNRLRMTCIQKKCNPKATDEHSPCLHISFSLQSAVRTVSTFLACDMADDATLH